MDKSDEKPGYATKEPRHKRVNVSLFGSDDCKATSISTNISAVSVNIGLGRQQKQQKLKKPFKDLSKCGATTSRKLTPQAKRCYRQAILLQRKVSKHKFQILSLQKRLKYLEKNGNIVSCLKDLNRTTSTFLHSQIWCQKFKSKGRRFTLDDKIFTLSLFKQSGKGYRFFRNIFSVPSPKTLLLNKIPFNSGINEAIFSHIKKRVKSMSLINRNCVLMFDEISLEPWLTYFHAFTCGKQYLVVRSSVGILPRFNRHSRSPSINYLTA